MPLPFPVFAVCQYFTNFAAMLECQGRSIFLPGGHSCCDIITIDILQIANLLIFIGMRKVITSVMLTFLASVAFSVSVLAQSQDPKQPSMEELATQEADRLGAILKLEDWQIFYVDSTLQHDYVALDTELKELQKSKVGNTDIYVSVQDKWMQQIYNTFQKIFDEDQWASYLKSGAAKEQKARDKRKAKAAGKK
jgi:hypothetical protein